MTVMGSYKHLRVAIAIIEETARMMKKMPSIIIMPIFVVAALIVLVVYWTAVAVYLASMDKTDLAGFYDGNSTSANQIQDEFQSNENAMTMVLSYHLFGLLWTNGVLRGVWNCVIIGAFSHLYWTRQTKKRCYCSVTHSPTLLALRDVLLYHLGSVIFGSFLITCVQFVRIAFEYFIRRTDGLLSRSRVSRLIVCCIRCILACFEKVVKIVSTQALIMVTMQGTNFMIGAYESYRLMQIHFVDLVTTRVMAKLVLKVIRIMIVAISMICMVVLLESKTPFTNLISGQQSDAAVSNPVFPSLICGVLAWGVTCAFVDIYHIGVVTLLFSYAADRELNDATAKDDGDGSPYAMSPSLYNIMHIEAPKYEFRDRRTGYAKVGAHPEKMSEMGMESPHPASRAPSKHRLIERAHSARTVAIAEGAAEGEGGAEVNPAGSRDVSAVDSSKVLV